jgi:hypothetical protein
MLILTFSSAHWLVYVVKRPLSRQRPADACLSSTGSLAGREGPMPTSAHRVADSYAENSRGINHCHNFVMGGDQSLVLSRQKGHDATAVLKAG